MRLDPVRQARARKALTTLGIIGFLAGVSLFGSTGTAAAVTATKSCKGTVVGTMGEKVYVHGRSVKELVRAAAKDKATGSEALLVWPDKLADDIEAAGALPVGQVPQAATGTVRGEAIGEAVRHALEGESGLGSDPDDTLDHIAAEVADACGLSVKASDFAPTTTQPSAGTERTEPGEQPASGTGSGSSPGAPGTGSSQFSWGSFGSGDARAPRRDYRGLPSAVPGSATFSAPDRYGNSPEFGVLGAGEPDRSVQNAGNADALAQGTGQGAVQLPMLLAVVALAGVSAALVRAWALRGV